MSDTKEKIKTLPCTMCESLADSCTHCDLTDESEKLYNNVRVEVIEECADKFAEILSNMTQICGVNCPIKCNWGTEDTCKEMCKKWFIEQLKEQK